jgi:hypothetical protein
MRKDTVLGSIVMLCALALISGYCYGLWWLNDFRAREQRWEEISQMMNEQKWEAEEARWINMRMISTVDSVGWTDMSYSITFPDSICVPDTLIALTLPKISENDTTIIEYERIEDQWYLIAFYYSAYNDGFMNTSRFPIAAWEVPGWAIIKEAKKMTSDIVCTCATCARQCGDNPPSNCCPRWHDEEGRNMNEAVFSALRENDQRERKEKGSWYYEKTLTKRGEDGRETISL